MLTTQETKTSCTFRGCSLTESSNEDMGNVRGRYCRGWSLTVIHTRGCSLTGTLCQKQKRSVNVHIAGLVAHRGSEKGARGPLGPYAGGPRVCELL